MQHGARSGAVDDVLVHRGGAQRTGTTMLRRDQRGLVGRPELRSAEIRPQTAVEPLDEVPEAGSRSRSTDDERVLIVGLTDAGAALRERATAVPGEVVSRLGLELEGLDALRTALVSFVAASTRAQGKLN